MKMDGTNFPPSYKGGDERGGCPNETHSNLPLILSSIRRRNPRHASLWIFVGLLLMMACAGRFRLERMRMPPGGLTVSQVPQFVTIGNDDVGYSGLDGEGGLQYLTDLFAERKNPDGSPLHYSFYVNT